MTTSDEEDNDSDNEEEPKGGAPKKPAKPKPDVVRALIDKDEDLSQRDLKARLLKIQLWKKLRKKFGELNEEYDLSEDFSWIDYSKDEDIYYAMGTKYKTSYRKGDQLFNCYGLRNNRFLLVNYGFCLRNNKYNSLGFKVFVNIKPK